MEPAEYELMDQAEGSMWWYRALHARLLAALVNVRGTLLDAGCGTGGFLHVLRQSRPELFSIGVEWAQPAASRAAAKSGAPVVRGSVNALPFASGVLDAVVSADVLCHAAVEPETTLAEMARVLRPGGTLVVNMPAYNWMLSAHDRRVHNVRRTTASALRRAVVGHGFVHPRARYWNGLLLPLMIIQRKLLMRHDHAPSDVTATGSWLDGALFSLAALELRWRLVLAAGGSILVTATRA